MNDVIQSYNIRSHSGVHPGFIANDETLQSLDILHHVTVTCLGIGNFGGCAYANMSMTSNFDCIRQLFLFLVSVWDSLLATPSSEQ